MSNLQLGLISADIRKKIEPYINALLVLYKNNILSVNLYGSAIRKDFDPKISAINLLVILKELTFVDLKQGLKLTAKGVKNNIPAPLFLTREHIRSSQDVFPMEFLEMQENYLCVYGEDILSGLAVKTDHLRLFCEEQIKGKLIRIRQAYLEIGLQRRGIEKLLKDSLTALVPVFRNILRIKGIVPPVDKEKVLTAIAGECGLDQEAFLAILRDKNADEKIAGKDAEVYFEKYLEQIQKLASLVDKL